MPSGENKVQHVQHAQNGRRTDPKTQNQANTNDEFERAHCVCEEHCMRHHEARQQSSVKRYRLYADVGLEILLKATVSKGGRGNFKLTQKEEHYACKYPGEGDGAVGSHVVRFVAVIFVLLGFCAGRFLRRTTNFNPDQTSLTAQTFTSTRPVASPMLRIIFSSKSDSTPELFFGQEIQSIPAGASFAAQSGNLASSSAWLFTNKCTKSSGGLPFECLGGIPSSFTTSGGT